MTRAGEQKGSHGVLLWGPPGCGKSSSARELSEKYKPMHFINIDLVVEHIIRNYYADVWDALGGADADIQKKKLYFKIRSVISLELLKEPGVKKANAFETIFKFANEVGNISVDRFEKTGFTGWLLKKYGNFTAQPVTVLYCDFVVWYAKLRQESFMIESTGNAFNEQWCVDTFGDVSAHLRVVYVDNVEELVARVAARSAQLVNAGPDYVRDVYANSYGEQLLKAMRSNIFKLIDVVDNSKFPATRILCLDRLETFNKYELVLEDEDHVMSDNARNFVNCLRKAIGHTDMRANFYCPETNRWLRYA